MVLRTANLPNLHIFWTLLSGDPGNTILLNGVLQNARRGEEVGVPGLQSQCENMKLARFCGARLQAGTLESSRCPPEGGRYMDQNRILTQTFQAHVHTPRLKFRFFIAAAEAVVVAVAAAAVGSVAAAVAVPVGQQSQAPDPAEFRE